MSFIKNHWKKTLILVLCVLAVIGLYSLLKGDKNKSVSVKIIQAENRVVTKTVSASGSIKSATQADLSFISTQKITKIYVKEGELVKKYQVLVALNTSVAFQNTQAAKDLRDIALRNKDLFVANEDSNTDTLGGEEQYEIKLREYNEEISRTQANYAASLATLNNSYMYAPFDGTIADISKNEGETATAGETIIKIADFDNLIFEATFDQEDYGFLAMEQSCEISLDSFKDEVFEGKIVTLPSFADTTENNNFIVEVSINPKEGKSPALGMTGDVNVSIQSTINPVTSLYYDQIFTDEENKNYIWVVDNGIILKQQIEIGLEGDIYTELKTNTDKQIVIPLSSEQDIKDGYKAKIVK